MIILKKLPNFEPYQKFKKNYYSALECNEKNVEAAVISTYNSKLKTVNSRYVNIKYILKDEWIFFSNYESPKFKEINKHPQISVLFFWKSINTQIRIKANAKKTSSVLSDAHFNDRSDSKNALSISSRQSQVISSFSHVKLNYENTFSDKKKLNIRPSYWGGISFKPYEFEFWLGEKNRLNKRELYKFDESWTKSILEP